MTTDEIEIKMKECSAVKMEDGQTYRAQHFDEGKLCLENDETGDEITVTAEDLTNATFYKLVEF